MRNTGQPPGSWYAATATHAPGLVPLEGRATCEVCVVGAGFTGLGAALELAARGASVVVLEAATVGSGGSGRNGGQVHTGQRRDQAWLEKAVGEADALALWRLAEDARAGLMALVQEIPCDWRPGLIHARHKPGGEAADVADIAHLRDRYGYDLIELIGARDLAQELGTDVYFGGTLDRGGGHLHPLNLALGMARKALAEGVAIHQRSPALSWRREAGRIRVTTPSGEVDCRELILSGDGYLEGAVAPAARGRVMPINNFIAVTEPLEELGEDILRSGAAVADSRFVVNYYRKTPDGRLLFGGGENYRPGFPADLAEFVRRHMVRVYPQLADVAITHAWGGTLGVTPHRVPYVRQVAEGVRIAAGYSGQGVMLAPHVGRLLARAALEETAGVDLLARLPVPPFPGGRLLRWPLTVAGLSWYALKDRL